MSVDDEWTDVEPPEEEPSDSETHWLVPGIIPAEDGIADEWLED
jgi:hypothetical protein